MASDIETAEKTLRAELDELRAQVASLLNDRVKPRLADARDEVEHLGRRAREVAHDETEAVGNQIRERPFTAVLIALAVGLLAGRLSR